MKLGAAIVRMVLGHGIAAVFGALATILAIRALQPQDWAVVALIVGFGPALGLLLNFGAESFQIRKIARLDGLSKQKAAASLFLARRMVIGVLICAVGVLCILWDAPIVGLLLLLAGLRFVRGGSSVLLSVGKRFDILSRLLALEKVVYFLVAMLLVSIGKFAVWSLPLAYAISLVAFTIMAVAVQNLPLFARDITYLVSTLPKVWEGATTFGASSIVGPIQQLDVAIVGALAGATQAGYFAAGSRLTAGLNVAGSAFSSVVLPYFSRGTGLSFRSLWRRNVVILLTVVVFAFVSVVALTPWWVPILLGVEYRPAVPVIVLYLVAIAVNSLNAPFVAYLQALNLEKAVRWILVGQAIAGSGLLAVGSWLGGAVGAATAFLLSTLCANLCLALVLRASSKAR